MQLASRGGKASLRHASNFVEHLNVRSIHIPRPPPPPSTAQRLVSTSRHLFSRFVAHLTAPGLHIPPANHSFTRAAHTSGQAAIRNGLSFPVRVALSRPLGAPALPRVPGIPRSVAQVGLGTARNFHSSRPIFQNLVENVPVAGRAFYEADWDLKLGKERENMRRSINKNKETAPKPMVLKIEKPSIKVPVALLAKEEEAAPSTSQEMDHYFPDPTPAVVTTLLIPLAPTPTTRMPLSERTQDQHLLPWQDILHMHAAHSTHSLRVSALFSRLDVANVWERGVRCSAFSHGTESTHNQGTVCTILKVEFVGWTKAEVRSVIGESGTGWCVLEEDREEDHDDMESLFSDSTHSMEAMDEGVTQSFVFPTLDMSSASFSPPPSIHTPFSTSGLSSPSFSSELEWDTASSPSGYSFIEPPTTNGYFGVAFSSSFTTRMSEVGWDDVAEPREYMF